MYFKKEGSNMGYNDDIKMLIDAQDLTLPIQTFYASIDRIYHQ